MDSYTRKHEHAPEWPNGSYMSVRIKLLFMFAFALCWVTLSIYLAQPWIRNLTAVTGATLAWIIAAGVALIPGYVNSFMIAGLILDRRPKFTIPEKLPGLSILVAAYNEEHCIGETLDSLRRQKYRGEIEIIVISDGSTDRTAEIVREYEKRTGFQDDGLRLELIDYQDNQGKSHALNVGLERARNALIATVDADSFLHDEALNLIVSNHLQSPPETAATAGCVLVRNSRHNLIASLQEWDYFVGISVVKRTQSLLQGTLVAQGAFSVYKAEIVRAMGGWMPTVGEDIVLTWAMIAEGYRIGFAENAIAFTRVPTTYGAFYRQRRRWARGMIEAFRYHPKVLLLPRLNTPFFWTNLLFPFIDLAYIGVLLPGIIAALFFNYYLVAGLMTLFVLPLALIMYSIMYRKQLAVFRSIDLKVRRNYLGGLLFAVTYQMIMSPASLTGYFAELLNRRKVW